MKDEGRTLMVRIRLLADIQTDKYLLKAGRVVLCNLDVGTQLEREGRVIILESE